MAGAPSLPQLLSSQSRAGTLFNTYTTAKRVMNDEDVLNIPGNYLQLGTRLRWEIRGALSNVASTPGNVFFQIMMGSVIAWTSGNLAFNASARTLLPFTLDIDLRVASVGPTTAATFIGQGRFGGIHLSGTDGMINVPTTAPAAGTGWDSVAAAGNVMELFVGFSNSQAGNGVQLTACDVWQLSKIAV
jgi:hypothetical protein